MYCAEMIDRKPWVVFIPETGPWRRVTRCGSWSEAIRRVQQMNRDGNLYN